MRNLDEERGALEISNEELKSAELEIAEMNAQLEAEQEGLRAAEERIKTLETKETEWSEREKWLLASAHDQDGRMPALKDEHEQVRLLFSGYSFLVLINPFTLDSLRDEIRASKHRRTRLRALCPAKTTRRRHRQTSLCPKSRTAAACSGPGTTTPIGRCYRSRPRA